MKRSLLLITILLILLSTISLWAQDDHIQTIFGRSHSSGGYGALFNKFTKIDGKFANISGVYGGWYVNHRFLIGAGVASTTNYIKVPDQYNMLPGARMTYEYGQGGVVTEYVIG